MIDIADPAEDFSVARFQAEARAAIAGVEARGNRALLVGGTGLYLRAVVDDLRFPGEDRELRDLIDARYAGDAGLARAYTDLTLRDQTAAARIEPGNRRRIMRALEVIQSTGRPFSSFGAGLTGPLEPVVPVRIAGIDVDRPVSGARIDARLRAHGRGRSRRRGPAARGGTVVAHRPAGDRVQGGARVPARDASSRSTSR